jgi:hypothetical protein
MGRSISQKDGVMNWRAKITRTVAASWICWRSFVLCTEIANVSLNSGRKLIQVSRLLLT